MVFTATAQDSGAPMVALRQEYSSLVDSLITSNAFVERVLENRGRVTKGVRKCAAILINVLNRLIAWKAGKDGTAPEETWFWLPQYSTADAAKQEVAKKFSLYREIQGLFARDTIRWALRFLQEVIVGYDEGRPLYLLEATQNPTRTIDQTYWYRLRPLDLGVTPIADIYRLNADKSSSSADESAISSDPFSVPFLNMDLERESANLSRKESGTGTLDREDVWCLTMFEAEFSGLRERLTPLGIEPNLPIQRLLRAHPERVEDAIAYVAAATWANNPSALFVTALREGRKPQPKAAAIAPAPKTVEDFPPGFLEHRAGLWKTGDTPKSKAFAQMSEPDLKALIVQFYARHSDALPLDLRAFQEFQASRARLPEPAPLAAAEAPAVAAPDLSIQATVDRRVNFLSGLTPNLKVAQLQSWVTRGEGEIVQRIIEVLNAAGFNVRLNNGLVER